LKRNRALQQAVLKRRICHARGHNADLPSQWLIYITVADLDASMALCKELGGKLLAGPTAMGQEARYCVI
jgi:predicted enzyme related to lactoylglutathione lyase